jgi:hypothetical protein
MVFSLFIVSFLISKWMKLESCLAVKKRIHTTYSWNIKWQKYVQAWVSLLHIQEDKWKLKYWNEKNKYWEPLNSTANPFQFGQKWAGLAVLFSR